MTTTKAPTVKAWAKGSEAVLLGKAQPVKAGDQAWIKLPRGVVRVTIDRVYGSRAYTTASDLWGAP